VALEDRGGDALDGRAVADVAQLPLGPELVRERPQTVLAPREQHELPAAPAQRSCDGGSDPARATGDER
jgi:hypothetical protein